MSSRDGAVTRMTGGFEEESAGSDSVLGCDEGRLSETEREKLIDISAHTYP